MTSPRLRPSYATLCRELLLPLGDRLSGLQVMRHYRRFTESQWWDRERLAAGQDESLRHTVAVAYAETPFYRRLFDAAGIGPADVRTVADLPKLPVVTKDMLRAAYPRECVRDSGRRWQEAFTSGSTGRPLVVRVDHDTLSAARALMLLRAGFSGWEIGESMLQTGMTLRRGVVRAAKDILLRTSYVSAFNLSDAAVDRILEIIERRRHRYLMGYAASLYLIAERAARVGFNWRLRGVVSWGDMLFPRYRSAVERQFGCRVTDTYGCGEGIQVSAQCGEADGAYHVFMPHVAVEFVRDGVPVPPGEMGEVVLTRLDPGAMPLIRYQVGDVGRADPRGACACGRGLALMRSIEGRSTDIVVTPRGNRLIVHFFTGIMEYARSVDTFQVVQSRPDRITVKIVPRGQLDDEEWARLKQEIQTKGDPDLQIDLEIVPDIPLERSNKRRFVISRLAG